MEETQRSFEEYLAEEVRRYDGVAVPVRSSLLRRALVRHLPPRRLHPNPADEFCNPKIGPNESIVARYKQLIVAKRRQMDCGEYAEPVIIERIRPDGYMILNGHHRWAAAVQYKEPDMRVSLVNLTHEMDVRQMLSNSRHEKRASLDLEEAVFPMTPDEPAEKPLGFPLGRIYRHRLRRGIPALFRYLNTHGYDIWVYSRENYSMDYLKELFWLHRVRVTGVVTGLDRQTRSDRTVRERIEALIKARYATTLLIDRDAVLRIGRTPEEYEEHPLPGDTQTWSQNVIKVIGEMEKHA